MSWRWRSDDGCRGSRVFPLSDVSTESVNIATITCTLSFLTLRIQRNTPVPRLHLATIIAVSNHPSQQHESTIPNVSTTAGPGQKEGGRPG